MSNGKSKGFVSSGIVVGLTPLSNREQRHDHLKGARVTMGFNAPRRGEGAVGDITIRTITNKGLRAYVKTNSGWVDLNTMVAQDRIEWVDMNLIGDWLYYGAAYTKPQYCKDDNGFVHLRGSAKSGSSVSADITTLPPGFRPPKTVDTAGAISGGQCSVQITGDGVVSVENGGSTSLIALDGV